MKQIKCRVCDNTSYEKIFNNTLVKCNICGFTTVNEIYPKEELENIYNENYFKGGEYLDYLADSEAVNRNSKQRIKKIKQQFRNYNPLNVLEIGCAYGLFGKEFTSQFINTSYTGFDIVKEACEYGKNNLKLNIRCEDFLNLNENKTYSDIFMWDVIEHLPEPEKYIEKISSNCNTGARIFISTGDIKALLPRIQGKYWRQIHPPSHLHYFSKKSLSVLLEKNGFQIKHVSYPGVYRSIKQTWFSLFLLNRPIKRIPNFIYKKISSNWLIKINTYDLLFIIAEKK